MNPLVVIAEDDDAIRRLVEMILRDAGCDVACAPNGEEALQLIRSLRPQLAILDVTMPVRSGFEVGRALNCDGSESKTPIIFLTSRCAETDIAEGFSVGAVDYVAKPFSPRDLRARVRQALTHADIAS